MATVLVADDDEGLRQLVTAILISAGHRVFTTANGLEAIALYRANPTGIDLIITDIEMPVLDGCEVARLVLETTPNAKIICMTGYTEKPFPTAALFLKKPFTAAALLRFVDGLLRSG